MKEKKRNVKEREERERGEVNKNVSRGKSVSRLWSGRCWVDSSYAEDPDTRRSCSSILITLGSSVVFSKVFLQPTVAEQLRGGAQRLL
jgi:hypothetical protein